jgi:hypothetical protein
MASANSSLISSLSWVCVDSYSNQLIKTIKLQSNGTCMLLCRLPEPPLGGGPAPGSSRGRLLDDKSDCLNWSLSALTSKHRRLCSSAETAPAHVRVVFTSCLPSFFSTPVKCCRILEPPIFLKPEQGAALVFRATSS